MAETFNRNSVSLTTTNATDVYQAPNVAASDRAIVLSCMVANKKAAAVTVLLTVTDSANASLSVFAPTVTIPANSGLECVVNKLILKQGEKLRATAGEASQLEVTVSALEIT
jgi:hypothetical protein